MARHKRISIEEQGGIEIKLDSEAELHNGFTYRHFDLFQRLRVPKTVQARLMNVKATSTIEYWQELRKQHIAAQKATRAQLHNL